MAMGQRLAVWRAVHDEGDQALSCDVWYGVLEDGIHLLELVGMRGSGRQRDCARRRNNRGQKADTGKKAAPARGL